MAQRTKGTDPTLQLIGALRTIRSLAASHTQVARVPIGGDGFHEQPTLWGEVYQEATNALRASGYPVDSEPAETAALDEMIEALRTP